MKLIVLAIAWFGCPLTVALAAETSVSPEIVTAPRLSSFSRRSGGWPHSTTTNTTQVVNSQDWWTRWENTEGLHGRYEGSPALTIRGSVKADRTLLLWDGIPLNLGDGFGPSELLVPHEVITSTRVFKGPASVFYGRSALGGVVLGESQVISSPRSQLTAGSFNSSAFSYLVPWRTDQSQHQASMLLHKTRGDFPFSMTSNSREGVRDHNQSEMQRYTLLGQSTRGALTIEHRLLYARKKGEYPGRIDQPETGFTPASGTLDRQSGLGSLRLSQNLNAHQFWSWTGAVLRADLRSDLATPLATDSRTDRFFQEFFFEDLVGGEWKYSLSVDHTVDEFSASYFSEPKFHNGEIDSGLSFEIPLGPTLIAQPALRYLDEYRRGLVAFGLFQKDLFGDRWITFGQGFRPPSLTDRFCNNAFCSGNRNLRPEQGEQIEIGFASAPQTTTPAEHQFQYGLSVFQMTHRDYFAFTNLGAQTQTINQGRAQIFGADGFAEIRRGALLARFGLSHLDGENLSDRSRLLLVPEWSGTWRLQRTTPHTSSYVQLRYWGSYLDQRDTSSPVLELGKAWFADLGWQWRHRAWALELSARNLFDQPLERRAGYPDPQQEWTVSLSHQN